MVAALRKLKADLPELAPEILASPSLADALFETLSPAVLNGMAEGVVDRQRKGVAQ
jgi:hypothetical protein